MSVTRAKIFLYFPDDIKSYYVTVSSFEPLIINLPRLDSSLLTIAKKITLHWQEDDRRYSCTLLFADENFKYFGAIEESFSEQSSHTVDYKGEYNITPIQFGDMTKFVNLAETINRTELSKLASRIEMTINFDNNDYPDIMLYLREINNKLDTVISMMKQEAVIENSFTARGISLNADKVLCFIMGQIDTEQKYFLNTTLVMSSMNVKFAAVCEVSKLDDNKYYFKFINLEHEVKDEIIRFIFAMERAILKELR